MSTPVSPWMTREEAAEYLRIAPRTLDKIVRAGELTRFHVRGNPRFRRAEVAALVKLDEHVGEMSPSLVKASAASLVARGKAS